MGIDRGGCEKAAHPLIESFFRLFQFLIWRVGDGVIESLQAQCKVSGWERLQGAQRDYFARAFPLNTRRQCLVVWNLLTRCSFCEQRHDRIQKMLFVPTSHLKSTSSARWIKSHLRYSGRVVERCLLSLTK
jgi:hypothetical protein